MCILNNLHLTPLRIKKYAIVILSCNVKSSSSMQNSTIITDVWFPPLTVTYSLPVVQAALLYTNLKGERRLRVHNLALNCSTKYQDIFRSCEIDTLINYFSKSSKSTTLQLALTQVQLYVHVHITMFIAWVHVCVLLYTINVHV